MEVKIKKISTEERKRRKEKEEGKSRIITVALKVLLQEDKLYTYLITK